MTTTTTTKQYGVKVTTKNLHYGNESTPIRMWVMRQGSLSLEHYEDPEIRVVEITQQVSYADRHGYIERTHYIDPVWGETWEHPSKVKLNLTDYQEKLRRWAELRLKILTDARLPPLGVTAKDLASDDFDTFTVALLLSKMTYEGLLSEDRNGGATQDSVFYSTLHGKRVYKAAMGFDTRGDNHETL